ncbi:DUF4145 domain-containing protein [Pelagibius sp.]|uniref:DUF4145 domain-containing protein n=1 Tax=Pelagibius sp. TaxID=1931238 RepID=UPI003BB0B5DB
MSDNAVISYEYLDQNIWRPEQGVQSVDSIQPQAIDCPHCRHKGMANLAGTNGILYKKKCKALPIGGTYLSDVTASFHFCPNPECRGLVVVVNDGLQGRLAVFPPELIDFNTENVPSRCQRTISEAVACHGAGSYRAAAMMIRRLLEEICDENDAEGKNLHERLQHLRTRIVLPEALLDAMGELKLLGNDAAHVEARQYDEIGKDESALAIELTKEIIKGLYQLEDLLARLQDRKRPG